MLNFSTALQTESGNHGCLSGVIEEPRIANFTDKHYLHILQSMGRPVYTYDRNANITYWNPGAEKLYGYTVPEAIGRNVVELLGDVQHYSFAADIIDIVRAGGSWTGEFPVKSKSGEKFVVSTTHTPVYDDDGTLFAIICVSTDLLNCEKTVCETQAANPSNLSNLASRMHDKDMLETESTYDKIVYESGDGATSSRGSSNTTNAVFGVFFNSNPDETFQFKHTSHSQRESHASDETQLHAKEESMNSYFTDNQCMMIFQVMGQSVHVMDRNHRILFWNKGAEQMYGFTDSEALGRDVRELVVEDGDYQDATDILNRSHSGETWSGQFPVTSKNGEKIILVATTCPFYDDNGTLFAVICIATDSRKFERSRSQPFPTQFEQDLSIISRSRWIDPEKPTQVAVSSKLLDLASKVSNKFKSKLRSSEPESGSEYSQYHNHTGDVKFSSILRGEIPPSVFGSFSQPYPAPHLPIKRARDYYRYFENGEIKSRLENIPMGKSTSQLDRAANMHNIGLCSQPSTSPCSSTTTIPADTKFINSNDDLDYEVSWKDLTVGKRIGQGSCGIVYHGQLYGSEVAIKVFTAQEFSNDLILCFKQEVSFMKRLRHPNILSFMGSVTSSKHLCIVSHFLPRGSLFRLLHRSKTKLDWKRRVHMALDIARGMNYLHHCIPPIIHHNLKSSNVLVDTDWSVKVGDFGLSPLKHQAFLTTKTGKGMPQWMAPEVMRTEPSNEKSDIYSLGVILWELATRKIPWDDLNPMQVVGAVGFMGRQLEIPKDVDPQWAAMIRSCWLSDPELRPTIEEIMKKLEIVNRQYVHTAQQQ